MSTQPAPDNAPDTDPAVGHPSRRALLASTAMLLVARAAGARRSVPRFYAEVSPMVA